MRCSPTPPTRSANGSRSPASSTRTRSSASSAPPTASPGSRPMSRRSASSRPMRSAMSEQGRFGEIEELLVRIGAGEFLAQMARRHPDEPGRARPPRRSRPRRQGGGGALSPAAADELIATGNTTENRARLIALMARSTAARPSAIAGSTTSSTPCARRCASSPTPRWCRTRKQWHRTNSYIPLEVIGKHGRARRVRPHPPRGVRRARPRQGIDVRRLRGAVARLYRRRLDRHPQRDRRGADPRQRHRRAEDANGCPSSPPARCCRPRSSPSPTPAPTSPRCAPAPSATATSTRSTATRPGSPIRCAPT